MALERHQKFRLEVEKKWTEKWFKYITSRNGCDWYSISKNPNITMDFIESHPEYNWNWFFVSGNPNLTIEFIEDHPKYNWNWQEVSRNPNLTMEFIKAHPNYNWDWYCVSKNPIITMEFFEAHPIVGREYNEYWSGVIFENG